MNGGDLTKKKLFNALFAASRALKVSLSEVELKDLVSGVVDRYESLPEKEFFFSFDFPQLLGSYLEPTGIYANILGKTDKGFLKRIGSNEDGWYILQEDMDRLAVLHLLAETVYKAKIKAHAGGKATLRDLLMQEQVLLNSILGRERTEEVSRGDLVRFACMAMDPATGNAYHETEEAVLKYGKALSANHAVDSEVLEGAFTMHTLRSLERVVTREVGPGEYTGRIPMALLTEGYRGGRTVDRPLVREADSLAVYGDRDDYVYVRNEEGVYGQEKVGFDGEVSITFAEDPEAAVSGDRNAMILRAAKSFADAFSRVVDLSVRPKIEVQVLKSLEPPCLPDPEAWHRFDNTAKGLIMDLGHDRKGRPCVRALVSRDFLHPETGRRAQKEAILETISGADRSSFFSIQGRREKDEPKDRVRRPIKVLFLDSPFSGAKAPMKVSSAALFLGTALKERGIGVEIGAMDFSAIEKGDLQECMVQEEILRRKLAKGYDIVAFGFSADIGIRNIDYLTTIIKENTDALIAVGGPLPTLLPEHVIAHLPRINILIRGEAEEAFARVLGSLALSRDLVLTEDMKEQLSAVRGCWLRTGNSYWMNDLGHRNMMTDLDGANLDFTLIKDKEVLSAPDGIPARILGLMFSRGCSKGCTFCSHVHTKKVRAMSVSKMIDTVLACQKHLCDPGVPFYLYPQDDDFFSRPTLAIEFMQRYQELVRKGSIKIRIANLQICLDSLIKRREGKHEPNEDLIDCLVQCSDIFAGGIPHLVLGTDSFTDVSIKRLNKGKPGDPYTFTDIEMVVKALDRKGVRNEHFVILTDPDSCDEDVALTCQNLAHLYDTYNHFDLKEVIPGIIPDPATPAVKRLQAAQKNLSEYLSADFLRKRSFPEFDFFEGGFVIPPSLEFFSFQGPHLRNLLFGTDRNRFAEAAHAFRTALGQRQRNA